MGSFGVHRYPLIKYFCTIFYHKTRAFAIFFINNIKKLKKGLTERKNWYKIIVDYFVFKGVLRTNDIAKKGKCKSSAHQSPFADWRRLIACFDDRLLQRDQHLARGCA
jgi:hypothetical protein